MRFLSVCSGIEAASVAWSPLGWEPVAFSEVEPFPCSVLSHHYPTVPNWGDMTKFKDWPDADINLLVGGTPCQSFSVAGLRKGLDDPRGSLLLTYLAIARRYQPQWLVWENVPGVLSADDGRAFGSLLGGLAELGYGFAYRVLDAQYFGLAQRRQRVFVVGHLGDWRRAAAVLFERESLSGHPAPRREAGQGIAGCLTPGAHPGGYNGQDAHNDMLVAHSLRADGFDASEDGTGRGTPLVPAIAPCLTGNYGKQPDSSDTSAGPMLVPYTLAIRGRGDSHDLEYRQDGTANAILTPNGGRGGIGVGAVAFDTYNQAVGGETAQTLCSRGDTPGGNARLVPAVMSSMSVRRLTPMECERLQGFPDGYTAVTYRRKPAADGPRYKALGNSMAVPVMAWIGRRIQMVNAIALEAGDTHAA